ncbi:ArsR/SmtB family transcription factor [Candidatus Avelusimicrobium alvi]|uniref:ArsR/SmtB family transcription factor n=1 Tax=Candidatus Avelusimicrobium alvi TaxID=3416221 RepID=UPI003D131475
MKKTSLPGGRKPFPETKGKHAKRHTLLSPVQMEDETLYDLADLFKVFGDSTRLRILCALFGCERCVQHIAEELGMTHSAISHQLRFLKQNKLVKNRREGKTVFYSLADEHVKTIFNQGLEHVREGL